MTIHDHAGPCAACDEDRHVPRMRRGRTFTARWAGACRRCGKPIVPGQHIVAWEDAVSDLTVWSHEGCSPVAHPFRPHCHRCLEPMTVPEQWNRSYSRRIAAGDPRCLTCHPNTPRSTP